MTDLTRKNPFQLIYSILSKHQNTNIQRHQRFEVDVETLDAAVKPRLQLQHIDAGDVLPTEQDLATYQGHAIEALEARLAATR